jgi:hypothetical protein
MKRIDGLCNEAKEFGFKSFMRFIRFYMFDKQGRQIGRRNVGIVHDEKI